MLQKNLQKNYKYQSINSWPYPLLSALSSPLSALRTLTTDRRLPTSVLSRPLLSALRSPTSALCSPLSALRSPTSDLCSLISALCSLLFHPAWETYNFRGVPLIPEGKNVLKKDV